MYDGDSEDNHQNDFDSSGGWDHDSEDEEHEDNNVDESGGDGQDTNNIKQFEEDTGAGKRRNRRSMIRALPSAKNGTGLNRPYWHQMGSPICPTLLAMVVAEQARIQMMKEYFEIEASKSTPQYGFRKGLKLFGNEGYQAAKDKLETNLLGRGCIDML